MPVKQVGGADTGDLYSRLAGAPCEREREGGRIEGS